MANKILVFDMDGTIADLYSVNGWLDDLINQNPRPYIIAKPLYNMKKLSKILKKLQKNGYRIIITSWLSKDGTKEYNSLVRTAKRNWLATYNFPYDEIHLVKYGTTKANCTRHLGGYQILIDDNEKVRNSWNLGTTIDANRDIIVELEKLL